MAWELYQKIDDVWGKNMARQREREEGGEWDGYNKGSGGEVYKRPSYQHEHLVYGM